MPRVAPKNPRDSPDLTSGGEPSRHNPEVGIMAENMGSSGGIVSKQPLAPSPA